MKVLIIGGTGLISTATTKLLAKRGVDLTIYNRGKTEVDIPSSVKTISGDRTDHKRFETQMQALDHFDCVIDMVCFLAVEAESLVRATRGRTKQLIFCSTTDVYTKPAPTYPVLEDCERNPRESFPYAAEKARCEKILQKAHAEGAFALTIIRPAATYGEGRGLVHSFRGGMYYHKRIRDGLPIITHGDGSSLWSVSHRDDVGLAFANAVGNPVTFGKTYHVPGEEVITWNQYHEGVAKAMGAPKPKLVHIPTDLLGRVVPKAAEWCVENFQYNNIFDNTAARKDLGYRYTIDWNAGVKRITAWLDERRLINRDDEPPFYEQLLRAWNEHGADIERAIKPLNA
ncbi:MAG TPA: NAD-dependent epimerase/dehydratase family protein [Spirochaetia bacterium]|nr:NAD-dependent epimerase/dehydratase family protein [Spirochaetia bacterium]